MEEKLSLVITLPESLAGLPIRFEVNSGCRNIALNLESSTPIKKKYLLIWNQTDYLKVDDEDILWIKVTEVTVASISKTETNDGFNQSDQYHERPSYRKVYEDTPFLYCKYRKY